MAKQIRRFSQFWLKVRCDTDKVKATGKAGLHRTGECLFERSVYLEGRQLLADIIKPGCFLDKRVRLEKWYDELMEVFIKGTKRNVKIFGRKLQFKLFLLCSGKALKVI